VAYKGICLKETSYFKLLEAKARVRATTWDEFADKIIDILDRYNIKIVSDSK